jgi:hypothetical protein
MMESEATFHPCARCGAWTPDAWSGLTGDCTSCFLTTRTLLDAFTVVTQSRWFAVRGGVLRRWRKRYVDNQP